MAFRPKAHALTFAVVATTIVIIVFAGLQYQWNADVTEATGVRLADTLQMSIVNWQLDLARDIDEVERALRLDSSAAWADAERWSDHIAAWRAVSRYPDLVDAVYLLEPDTRTPRAWRLDQTARRFAVAPWPAGPIQTTAGALPGDDRWHFDPVTPSLVRRLNAGGGPPRVAVVALSLAVMRDRILPDLARRYFQGTDGLDYEVAVVAGEAPRRVLYTSDAGFGAGDVNDADGVLRIFGRPRGRDEDAPPISVFHKTAALVTINWLPLLDPAVNGQDWTLVVRHRRGGPLGAFLKNTYRRDLFISGAALLLLVTSIAMLVVTSSRAQKLAALQMDFVTTVSHELRTPLTVISSAADNITQGVVEDAGQVRQYGAVIGNQVRQLSTLVEQILLFATHGRNPQQFTLRPLAVTEILDATLASTTHLITAAHFTVECTVPDGLPSVQGDLVAVSQCLQNFIVNALKYGRDGRWIGIHAGAAAGPSGPEVQIAVSDRGSGIADKDLPHIFEPFYRSAEATSAQIHGTGLGLSVARDLARAMAGRITVESALRRGSTFTLHLACAGAAPSTDSAMPQASSIA